MSMVLGWLLACFESLNILSLLLCTYLFISRFLEKMTETQVSLSWDAQNHLFTGLSFLQQNGEFVDMTIAADGHFVKVHQIIVALGSPYLKELINSANCPHPVIFLNNVSYKTLTVLLEYLYTGEVMVPLQNLNAVIEAGKQLHIKGLTTLSVPHLESESIPAEDTGCEQVETTIFETELEDCKEQKETTEHASVYLEDMNEDIGQLEIQQHTSMEEEKPIKHEETLETPGGNGLMQYTVSNQGSIQMILNRYVYYLKYTDRSNVHKWRCIDYLNKTKCPAYVATIGDYVVKRIAAHTHGFHDKRILRKLKLGAVFSRIKEVQDEADRKKIIFVDEKTKEA